MEIERLVNIKSTKGKAIRKNRKGGGSAAHRLKVTGADTPPTGVSDVNLPSNSGVRSWSKRVRDLKDDLPYPAWSVRFKEPAITLSSDRLTATGYKGWTTVLLTHGANFGCWYFEAVLGDGNECIHPSKSKRDLKNTEKSPGNDVVEKQKLILNKKKDIKNQTTRDSVLEGALISNHAESIEPRKVESEDPHVEMETTNTTNRMATSLGLLVPGAELNFTGWIKGGPKVEPHIRIGWSCRYSRLDVPIGCDAFGVCIRDIDGSVVQMAKRQQYANIRLGRGSVIGCAIVLGAPACHLADPRTKPELHPFLEAGLLCDPARPPRAVPNVGSSIEFTVNGCRIGPAAVDLPTGMYHPAVSFFMGSQCRINLGPEFIYLPPSLSHTAQELTGFSMYHPASRLPKPDY